MVLVDVKHHDYLLATLGVWPRRGSVREVSGVWSVYGVHTSCPSLAGNSGMPEPIDPHPRALDFKDCVHSVTINVKQY